MLFVSYITITYFLNHRLDKTNIEEHIVTGNTANCMVTLGEFSSRLQISMHDLDSAQLFSLFEKVNSTFYFAVSV